jgi:hypothetical protein
MDADVFFILDIDRCKVPFSKVYACFLGAFRFLVFFDFVLSAKLILIAVPADLDSFRFLARRPVDQYRGVPSSIREAKYAVVSKPNCGRLPLDLEMPLLLVGRAEPLVVSVLALFTPTLEAVVEAIRYRLSRLTM